MRSSLSRRRDEAGAVAILVALSLTLILIVAAMVLDFGLVRVDRQVDKSAADAATLAGLHALNGGDASPRPFAGVCGAINYLQQNNDRFAAMTPAAGAWSDGASPAAAIAGNPCTDTTLLNQACSPGSPSTWAKFTWTATLDSQPFAVVVQSGYQLSTTSGYGEDSIQAAQADNDDSAQGCDQLAVLIDQQRAPGLGSLASTTDLRTSIRSVGRVKQDTGGYAPAMLLLEQKTCPVLESGSNSGGSFIHVLGAEASDGTTQPGTIHSDSDASVSCSGGSNQNLFLGKGNDGVVAYAAPLAGSPGSADASKPGQLTSYAGLLNKALKFIIDNDSTRSSSYAATGVNTASPGTHKAPTGLPRVTRKPVDSRYFTGVKGAISAASTIFTGVTPTTALGLGYKVLSGCSATQADVDALSLTATSWLYVDCNGAFSGPNGALNIPAQRIVFRGSVAPQRIHTYGNATQVYINGSSGGNAVDVGNNAGLKVHTAGLLDGSGRCTASLSSSKAIMVVKAGRLRESNGGQIQFCGTTVIMMGGRTDGCVPAAVGTAPTITPCFGVNSGLGDGHLLQQGGDIDWTAPNALDLTIGSDGLPTAAAVAAWSDPNGPEDLAYWSESASGGTANDIFRVQGGGAFNLRGVFMAPNAIPFTIGGGATLTLTNAQFIARTIALNGTNTNITMRVDGNSAVRLPKLTLVGLVR